MARKDQRRAVDAGVKINMVDAHIAALEERNANLTKEVERLQAEVYRLEGVVRQANSDRDNWRRQALEENARLEAVLSCIRRYAEAEKAESIAADESLKAYNRKQAALRELLLCQTAKGGGKEVVG